MILRSHLETLADRLTRVRIRRGWVVCPHCGAQAWREPPHGYSKPCPLLQQITDSTTLKLDAERNLAIRTGQHMELASKIMEQHVGEEDDDE